MLVAADLQLCLLLPPQLQQDSGSCATRVIPPAEHVRQGVGVFTQLQQSGKDDAVNALRAHLCEIRTRENNASSSAFYISHTQEIMKTWKKKISRYLH